MILVKSLIVLFLLLLLAHFYNYFFKPAPKESFIQQVQEEEEEKEESFYTLPTPLEKHHQMALDPAIMDDLKDKMNELQQLSDKVMNINEKL